MARPRGGSRDTPDASVIVPIYNGEHDLNYFLRSLDDLAGVTHEVILVNDGSTDDTGRMLDAFAATKDHVAVIHLSQNGGVAAARNIALERARGKWVWFVDVDDGFVPNALEQLKARAEATNSDVVLSRLRYQDADGNSLRTLESWPRGNHVYTGEDAFDMVLRTQVQGYLHPKLFRRALIVHGEQLFPATKTVSDMAGVARLISRAKLVATLDEQLYYYTRRAGSLITSANRDVGDAFIVGQAVLEASGAFEPVDRDRRRMSELLFKYRFVVRVAIGIAGNQQNTDAAKRALARVRSEIKLAELLQVALISPRTGVVGSLPITLGPLYLPIYHAARSLKSALDGVAGWRDDCGSDSNGG